MLLDIQEPGQHQSNAVKDRVAVGIDLGTTNSLVAYSINQQPQVISDSYGEKKILPSIVTYLPSGGTIVGVSHNSGVSLSSVKRFMGKSIDQFDQSSLLAQYIMPEQDNAKSIIFDLGFRRISPIEASAEIFRELKSRAEEYFGKPVEQAVITVPAYFDDAARIATKHAAHLAGLQVLRLINEPTAAALAYGLDKKAEGKYIIYDLGGGTFDVSVLNLQKGIFQVLATGGDVNLGGDDIDYLLVELIKKQLTKTLGQAEKEAIYYYARQIKETLSHKNELSINIKIGAELVNISLKRSELENLISLLIERTLKIVRNVIKDAQIKHHEIKGLVLVGGSTRIPLIKAKLEDFFGVKCLDDINPDEVVALGAAIQAESLTKGSNSLLIDVTSLSLGLEVIGELNEKIIVRNSPLPISITKEFTTYQDGQKGMKFHVVQGERELVKDCRSLAKFELRGIPPMNAGMARISVNFTIDVDGILTVSAQELSTGSKQIVDIKPSYGLDIKQVEQMLFDAMKNAERDVVQRLFLETKFNARRIIDAINKDLAENSNLLSRIEEKNIVTKISDLQKSITTEGCDQIEKNLQKLKSLITDFNNRKMNKYIAIALQGKNINDI